MSPEPVSLTAIIKYIWLGTIVPAFVFLFKRLDSLRDSVYTKEETDKVISNQLSPILTELKRNSEDRKENTKALKELSDVVVDLRIHLATQESIDK